LLVDTAYTVEVVYYCVLMACNNFGKGSRNYGTPCSVHRVAKNRTM